jgi:hypothetical protein
MKPTTRCLVVALALLAVLLLAACPRATPATPTVSPTAIPTPVSATPTPEGWVQHSNSDVTIWLPKEWDVLDLGQGDLQTIYANFEKDNPELARIIGSADALQDVALWAFKTGGQDAVFADNMNVRRNPLGAQKIESMQDVVGPVLDQYRQLGFEIGTSEADLRIGGHPAAHITYSFQFAGGDGKPIRLSGSQYLVATPTDLWILSFSAAPGNETTLAPIFEQAAQSFRTE